MFYIRKKESWKTGLKRRLGTYLKDDIVKIVNVFEKCKPRSKCRAFIIYKYFKEGFSSVTERLHLAGKYFHYEMQIFSLKMIY